MRNRPQKPCSCETGGSATVTIRSLDPSLLQFPDGTSQTIALAAGSTEPVKFDGLARGIGTARVQMTIALGEQTDAFETTLPIQQPAPIETNAPMCTPCPATTPGPMTALGWIPGAGLGGG